MLYKKSLRVVGVTNIFIGLVLAVLCFLADDFIESRSGNERAVFILSFGKIIIIFLSVVFLLRGIGLTVVGGGWKIILTKDYMSWQVPSKSNFFIFKSDDTFNIKISEISEVILDGGLSKGDDFYASKCIFVTKLGDKYRVSVESGINLEKVTKKLECYGVKIEKV